MAEKRVSVRLSATGGDRVRAELEGVGRAGQRGFGRLSAEMEAANKRLAGFARRARQAGAVAAAALAGIATAAVRSALDTVDAQAKLAASLGTTTESIQVLTRAGELSGVAFGSLESAAKDFFRRLSQAASGTGPAVDALARLKLTAGELLALPLDERLARVNAALARFVPEAERAAVAGQLFGEEGSLNLLRISSANIRTATEDIRAFGVAVSEQDAAQIERTNDAISRLGLVWIGLANTLAAAAAPALETVADAIAAVSRTGGPLNDALRVLGENIGRIAAIAAAFAGLMAGRVVAGIAAAALSVRGLATALVVLRGAILRTGIGALVVGAGELLYQLTRLVSATGSWSETLNLLGDVAAEVWTRIRLGGEALAAGLQGAWHGIRAGFLSVLADLQTRWAGFIETIRQVPGLGAIGDPGAARGAALDLELAAETARAQQRGQVALAGLLRDRALDDLTSLEAIRTAIAAAEARAVEMPPSTTEPPVLPTPPTASGDGTGGRDPASSPSDDPLARVPEAATPAWEGLNRQLTETDQSLRGLGEAITGPLKDALRRGELGWRSFADAVSRIASNLADRLITQAFKPIEDALARAFSGLGSGGGSGSFVSSLIGTAASALGGAFGGGRTGLTIAQSVAGLASGGLYATGGVFGPAGELTAFARGGVVERPAVFPFARGLGLMGESGPEAILPLRRGPGGRLGVEASGQRPATPEVRARIVNVLDPGIVGQYLTTAEGEQLIVNTIRRNRELLDA